ncbi:hypothetical protein BUALT_Bualt16G0031100 [Buddleja alternifolia]|uniref:RNase H type-1 domain-containing protein n=1 Tax=Buddleja alternifolia TaxID=168488 RepID=A0AAV6WE21_9LAMI|nr:hypothetical protein BUALT_Bualt16G0031100 [Buddleja alternifolia]
MTSPNTLPLNALVASLIDPVTRTWNADLVQHIFLPPDVDTVLSTPLGRYPSSDTVVWHYTKNGIFAVKIAYHVVRSMGTNISLSSSIQPGNWSFSWGAKVPHRHGMKIQSARSSSATWNPPPNGVIKVNFDGAMLSNMCGVGAGVLIRDANGICVGWLSKFFLDLTHPEHAEAVAAQEAMELLAHGGWRDVILEGDCAQVISKLRNPYTDSSLILLFYVKRTGNRVAHTLASSATFSLEGSINPPTSVIPFLVAEYSVVA